MTGKRDVTNDYDDPEFDRLIEQSSLGAAAARRLRSRVSAAQVDKVRRRLARQGQTLHSDSGADIRIAVSNNHAGQREISVSLKRTHASVTASVREIVADALGVSQGEIDVDQPLNEQGLNSLTMLEIRAVMEKSFDVELPAALFWEQPPTVVQMADCILAQHSSGRPEPIDPQDPFTLGPRDGVAGKFNKDAR